MNRLLLLCLAGAAGTLARYWLSNATYAWLGRDFPWGTFCVNVVGCALFGFVLVLAEERHFIHDEARLVLLVGFMGSFTTFSSFIYESASLATAGNFFFFTFNIVGQLTVGLAAYHLGSFVARLL